MAYNISRRVIRLWLQVKKGLKTVGDVATPAVGALLVPLILMVSWAVLTADSASLYFPAVTEIADTFIDVWMWDGFRRHLLPSVSHLAVGFTIAAAVGVSVGIVIGLIPRAQRDIQPITEFFRATPVSGVVPLAVLVLGVGSVMEITLIAFASLWPILLSTTDGVRGTDRLMLDVARVYGLSRRQQIIRVVIPAALPRIFAGLRVAVALAVTVTVFANMFGQANGIGFFVILSQQSFNIPATWAGIVMIGLVGVTSTLLLVVIQHRLLRWHRGWSAATDGGR